MNQNLYNFILNKEHHQFRHSVSWDLAKEYSEDTTTNKYGGLCRSVVANILPDFRDVEECVSDTWHNAWQAMPPERPTRLQAFLGRITRNLAISRFRKNTAKRRDAGIGVLLSELEDCVPAGETTEEAFDRKLLEQVSFSVHAGEKVALVGANGTGKTSMLRHIWQNRHPSIHFSEDAKPAFFSQLHAEILNEEASLYDALTEVGIQVPGEAERHLENYCFDPDSLGRRVGVLSGGEKNLLQLAKLAAGDANILLLDEPSSHLDTFAQEALEEAVEAYPGAVLMVSHDFYTIANCVDSVLFVENGTVRPMSGRAFRKMIYKHHFNKDYLLLEQQKKELEIRIAHCLKAGDCVKAQTLCDQLGDVVDQM